jgi:hypothetical protein
VGLGWGFALHIDGGMGRLMNDVDMGIWLSPSLHP